MKQGIHSFRNLNTVIRYNKIGFQSGNIYNKRWQGMWKPAYYTYPRDWYEHTYVKKPEDSKDTTFYGQTMFQDIMMRFLPASKMLWERRRRAMDPFQLYVLPTLSFLCWQFWPVSAGFKILTILPAALFYTRLRDRTRDPDLQEKYLRDFIHENAQLSQLFKPETIHVMDYELEYDEGIPDPAQFPEFNNKVWRFFNSDAGFTTGHFKFGDLESGATMHLKFKTMPIRGSVRYQVGEPFYIYDMIAEVNHQGEFKEIVLVDKNVELKQKKPFLFLI